MIQECCPFYPEQHLLTGLRNLGEELRERTSNELTHSHPAKSQEPRPGRFLYAYLQTPVKVYPFLVNVGNVTDERFCSIAINPNFHLNMWINTSFHHHMKMIYMYNAYDSEYETVRLQTKL